MTKKEARKLLTNTKVYVRDKSKEIQIKLFSLGFEWELSSKSIQYTNMPFIYISDKYMAYGTDVESFYSHGHNEITPEDILNITIESGYRPFKNVKECIEEMKKHQPFGWLKFKESDSIANIGSVYQSHNAYICYSTNEREPFDMYSVYKDCTFLDGTPFGIKEE